MLLEFLLQQNTDRDKKIFINTIKELCKNDKIALFLLGLYYEQNKFKEVNFTQSTYYQFRKCKTLLSFSYSQNRRLLL